MHNALHIPWFILWPKPTPCSADQKLFTLLFSTNSSNPSTASRAPRASLSAPQPNGRTAATSPHEIKFRLQINVQHGKIPIGPQLAPAARHGANMTLYIMAPRRPATETKMTKVAGIPQEEINKLKHEMLLRKAEAFDMLRYFTDGTMEPKTSGFKSIEDAAVKLIGDAVKKNEKAMQALERKYPD
jgi:hypothetical protein